MLQQKEDTLFISGALNFSTVTELWQTSLPLLEKLPHARIDFAKVSTVNSAGLALLIEWIKYARSSHKKIQFENIPSHLLSVASIINLDEMLKEAS